MALDGDELCFLCWLCFSVVIFGKAAGREEEQQASNLPFSKEYQVELLCKM
jgi:hypothetical protein